jgi:hypothetical protein
MSDQRSAAILSAIRKELGVLRKLYFQIALKTVGHVDQAFMDKLNESHPYEIAEMDKATDADALDQILTELKRLQELAIMTQNNISTWKQPQ